MKKLAIIVLALAALSFGCKVGDSRWCHVNHNYTDVAEDFGGPEHIIRKLLKNPCEGTRVDKFLYWSDAFDEPTYHIECRDSGITLLIWKDQIDVYNTGDEEPSVTIRGEKARRAFRLADNVAKEITRRANNYKWNP